MTKKNPLKLISMVNSEIQQGRMQFIIRIMNALTACYQILS